jgi:transcriptional antiterminator RfaH
MMTWCVVHTQPFKEVVAQQHLLDQGFAVYLPRFKKRRRHARKVEEVLAPLFPRYLFVGMDLATVRWRCINSTRGVSYLLMRDEIYPAQVPEQVITELKAQETREGFLPLTSLSLFTKGDKVRILEGAFQDQLAIFEGLDDKARVQLLLTFLGREVRITLPAEMIEAA